jgi:alginate O-acetyltransferase complex protein AlgI
MPPWPTRGRAGSRPVLFNSYVFVFLFLPLVLLGFAFLSKAGARRGALGWLVFASLVFYGWWKPVYLLLLVPSIVVNFNLGLLIGRRAGTRAGRLLMIAGVAANLATLAYYKYANFLVDSWNAVSGGDVELAAILLPVGISFFTFQQIAYLVDAWEGQAKEYRLMEYALFVTFFPQFIAGPIVHHGELLPQFARRSTGVLTARNFSVGAAIFIVGLAKKVVFADNVSVFATPVFRAADAGWAPSLPDAWIGALAYSLQIYFDFSGYSDMAIGLGRMFGIRLPLNFHSPYKATSIVEFWRRWHMTLSRFLRDYLYVPLGGNRQGKARRYVNLMLTMVLGGLWHGAGWTYVFWGLLHGVYLCVNHAWAAACRRFGGEAAAPGPVRRVAATGATFLAVLVAWLFFRAATFGGAGRMLEGMAGLSGTAPGGIVDGAEALPWIAGLLAVVWLLPNTHEWMARWRPASDFLRVRPPSRIQWTPSVAWALALGVAAAFTVAQMAKASEFIYYQF